jgi:hypothetical protein
MLSAHQSKPPRTLPDGSGAAPSRDDAPVARKSPDDDAIARLAKASETAAPPARPPHPTQGIGEDFISRALTGGTLAEGDVNGAAPIPDAGRSPSIIVQPPPGSMSLGRGTQ